jgi:phage recombination protein Bet
VWGAPRRLTDPQVRIIRLSVARSCTDAEFDHFIAVAERTGLDPLRRQISAIVVGASDPAKRTMAPLVTIDGLRAIAARSGDYRPMEDAPILDFDAARKDEGFNPLGLVRAEVKVWRRFGETWFPITGEAWWDEYAAIAESGEGARASTAAQGDRRIQRLASNWRRMGRVLLAKCAEAQALRRGWPEDLSGLYGEEELQRAEIDDLLAHERAERAAEEARQRALAGGRALLIAFEDGALEPVPRADLALKLAAFVATAPNVAALEAFQARNRAAFKTFWDWSPGQALDIKQQTERALTRLRAFEQSATQNQNEHESNAPAGQDQGGDGQARPTRRLRSRRASSEPGAKPAKQSAGKGRRANGNGPYPAA